MTKNALVHELMQEAKGNSLWVVITDKGDIWGSEASLSALKMGGGKSYILKAADVRGWIISKEYINERMGLMNWINNDVVWFNEIYEHVEECIS